jgi:acetylornithine deacetylase
VAAQQMHTKLFVSPTTSDMALMPFPSIKLGAGKSARSHSKNEYIEIAEIQHAINYYNQYIQTLASLL